MIEVYGTFTTSEFTVNFTDSSAITDDRRIDKKVAKDVLIQNISSLLNEVRSEIIASIGEMTGYSKQIKPTHNSLSYHMEISLDSGIDYYGHEGSPEIRCSVKVVPVKIKKQ